MVLRMERGYTGIHIQSDYEYIELRRSSKTIFMLAILVFLALVQPQRASVPKLIMPISESCMQVNATAISCADASGIGVSFPIASGYPAYYGNFTVSQADSANISEPLDLSGLRCIAGSEPSWCSVRLKPIGILEGNGSLNASVGLRLSSIPYPEIRYNYSINLTIYHHLTAYENKVLRIYNSTFSALVPEADTYMYICGTYGICNSSIGIVLINASAYLHNATLCAESSNLECAYYNASLANMSVLPYQSSISAFITDSNIIINNNIRAYEMIVAAKSNYTSNYALLRNCTQNSTALNESLASALNYTNPVTLPGSAEYLNYSMDLSAAVGNAIAQCKRKDSLKLNSIGIHLPSALGSLGAFAGSSYFEYLAGAIATILLALYARARINSVREVSRIRKGVEADELSANKKQPQENEIKNKESVIEITADPKKQEPVEKEA